MILWYCHDIEYLYRRFSCSFYLFSVPSVLILYESYHQNHALVSNCYPFRVVSTPGIYDVIKHSRSMMYPSHLI